MLELKDLLLTPLYLGFFYLVAYGVRGRFTNIYTRRYFIPALTVKFVGAIALGLVYAYYYEGGDTFNYYYHVKLIHEAFAFSFEAGMKLMLTSGGTYDPETARFTTYMYWYQAGSAEYLLSRLAAAIGFLCFNTYMIIALFFAIISFTGMWAMYITFVKIRPQLYKELAIATFFIPSVFFWGSGLMKDPICLGALGWLFYAFYKGAIQKRSLITSSFLGLGAAYALILLKIYILLCFLPAALLWIFNENSARIKNGTVRILAKPILLSIGAFLAFFAATNLTKGDEHYDIDRIGERSKIVSEYLYETGVKQNGSAYNLGEQDGTLLGMVKLVPQAIVVSLYRPFIWEVRNPVMLLSSIEALVFIFFTLRIIVRSGLVKTLSLIARTPSLTLCFIFALAFSGTVGVVSANFGTLVRYKIPMIPFYVAGLYITQSMSVARRKATAPARGHLVPA
ncbi:hypothetical protein [Hymenobacter arizonensis]|uniref:Dolichyl-phosphate-mannose-protein mannosyltransferase n=1 Tax=Hymenobacter arizonensis TaxID=1227077 RepID=A0A1I5YRL2_HYMAR|nr:hypothetical protein [Hymenobacter arizonensis]SFQ46883.1 hypothetical protein SAMN04515668_2392 [Hymenobacter arizonensis]